jgi:Kinesin motor domain
MGGIFSALENHLVNNELQECSIRCSVVEVYLERLRDLLHEPSAVQLDHSPNGAGRLSGCVALACLSAEDAVQIIDRARTVRTSSAMIPNETSHRSTAVIQLTIQQTLQDGTTVESRLHIIDLLGCELVQQAATTSDTTSLEAVQVSLSLKALHKQIRHLATGKPPIPMSDIPILAQLLSYSFSSTNLSLFLTASPCASGSESLFQFGADCQRVRVVTLERHRRPANNTIPWRRLAKALAMECDRAGVAHNDGTIKLLMQRIKDNDVASFDEPTNNNGGQNHDQIRLQCERAKSERDQLCSDLAILQAQTLALTSQNQKVKQEMDRLQQELRSSQFQRYQVEETLRISQFREAEAVVFLRQLRRFYFRLLQKTASEGSPDNLTMQMIDMDHFMMKSGLLEESEVGGDVTVDCRPSRQSLERSMAEREQAEKHAQMPTGTHPSGDSTGSIITLMDDQQPLPVSVNKREDPGKVEARQRLYKTPAGRYIAMRERILEEEVMQLSEINSQLHCKLREVMANLKDLSAKGGITASLDKLRVGQEIRALNEQLSRKNNDLKAVIWKMNELHMIGKTLQTQTQSKDGHISHLEQSLLGLSEKHTAAIEDRKGVESSLQLKVNHLKGQLQSLLIPVWQLSTDRRVLATVPLQGRMTIPFGNVPLDQRDNESLGEAGEWADLGFFPDSFSGVDKITQTGDAYVDGMSTQTMESVYIVDRRNTRSIEVQTDDVMTDALDIQMITESNIESFMFMMSPQSDDKPKLNASLLNSKLRAIDVIEPNTVGSSTQIFSTSPIGSYALYGLPVEMADDRRETDPYENTSAITKDSFEADDEMDFSSKLLYETYVARTLKVSQPVSFRAFDEIGMVSAVATDLNSLESAHSPVPSSGQHGVSPLLDTSSDVLGIEQEKALDAFEGFRPSGIVGPRRATSHAIETSDHLRKISLHANDGTAEYMFETDGSRSPTPKLLSSNDRERYSPLRRPSVATDQHIPLPLDATSIDRGNFSGPMVQSPPLQEKTESEGVVVSDDSEPMIASEQMPHRSDKKITDVGPQKGALRATKSEGSPKNPRKPPKTNRNLTSFLDRLQNQAKKRLEDDDEKTKTPEFMKLFKKIGGKNKHEQVVETSGKVAPRDAQRTSFEQLKGGHVKVVDPRQMEAPSKSWQPKKKQPKNDSDSSDDNSFQRNFATGLQKGASARNSDPVKSHRNSGGMASEQSESDSDDDSFARSFIRGAQVPSNAQYQKADSQTSDADNASSSPGDDEAALVTAEAKTEEVQALSIETHSSSSHSNDLVQLNQKSGMVAPPEATKGATSCISSDDSSTGESNVQPRLQLRVVRPESSSDSSDEGNVSPVKTAAPVAKQIDSDNSSSSDDSSVPIKRLGPSVSAPARTVQADNFTRDGSNQKSILKAESSSSSSDSSSRQNQPAKSKATTNHAQAAKPPLLSENGSTKPSAYQRSFNTVSKDDSSSSSDDSSTKSAKLHVGKASVRPPQQKPSMKTKDSDDSSVDSESETDIQRSNSATKAVVTPNRSFGKTAASSKGAPDGDSSDSGSSFGQESTKNPIAKTVAPRSASSSDDESSSDNARKTNGAGSNNMKKNQQSSSDESSSSSSGEENKKTAINVQQSKMTTMTSCALEKSGSSGDEKKRPADTGNKASTASSDDSNSSSDRAKRKKKPPGDPKLDQAKSPKIEVPDFAAKLKQAAAKAKRKKRVGSQSDFVIRDGMVIRRSDVKDEPGNKKKTPQPAKSPVATDASSPRRKIRNRSLVSDKKFELKDGKLVRTPKEDKVGAKKAAFKIVGGKLVKADDEALGSSSEDSDCTEKMGST